MTERSGGAVQRAPSWLQVGPSRLAWQGDTLVLQIDEVTAPWPSRLRGQVRLHPSALQSQQHLLDAPGRHRWWPIAPCARVEVEFDAPALRWRGHGYLDSNRGDEPLERGFAQWHWSRAALADGSSAVLYDARRRDGSDAALALHFSPEGDMQPMAHPPVATLAPSAWRIARSTRCDAGPPARVHRTLEDGPFYARSLIGSRWLGHDVQAMHESLDLDRFGRRIVQAMLPFRMPRRAG